MINVHYNIDGNGHYNKENASEFMIDNGDLTTDRKIFSPNS